MPDGLEVRAGGGVGRVTGVWGLCLRAPFGLKGLVLRCRTGWRCGPGVGSGRVTVPWGLCLRAPFGLKGLVLRRRAGRGVSVGEGEGDRPLGAVPPGPLRADGAGVRGGRLVPCSGRWRGPGNVSTRTIRF
ncbi:hypothetical protein GCM10009540_01820 [Streptomyces turgidiscabies]